MYSSKKKEFKEALKYPIILDFSNESQFAKFSCLPNCQRCCGYSYYIPTEIINLPRFVQKQLIEKENKFEIIQKDKRCIFYSQSTKNYFFCTIHDIRPIRCRIYPFFPLIVNKRIIITLEPALKMLNDIDVTKQCPGIGRNGKTIEIIKKECLEYLNHLILIPQLLDTIVLDNYKFNMIRDNKWFSNASFQDK